MSPDSSPSVDFAAARQFMVDGQLRPTKVTDRRILEAMRRLPREAFVPPALAALAYIDQDLPIAPGRVLLKPLVLARLLQLANPRAGETALIVGAGCGYGAAILAACGGQVTALEPEAVLLDLARAAPGTADIHFVQGKLAAGFEDSAPYDLVVIEGAVRDIPAKIGAQVAATGRLVTIMAPATGGSYAAIAEPSTGALRARAAFDAVAPFLPDLAPTPGFVF